MGKKDRSMRLCQSVWSRAQSTYFNIRKSLKPVKMKKSTKKETYMQSSNPPRSFQEKRKTQIGINNDNKKKVNENMRYEELKMTMRKE